MLDNPKNRKLIRLLVGASQRWKRPPDYAFIFKETGFKKADVLRLLQRDEIHEKTY
jgi:hypothetical protein